MLSYFESTFDQYLGPVSQDSLLGAFSNHPFVMRHRNLFCQPEHLRCMGDDRLRCTGIPVAETKLRAGSFHFGSCSGSFI